KRTDKVVTEKLLMFFGSYAHGRSHCRLGPRIPARGRFLDASRATLGQEESQSEKTAARSERPGRELSAGRSGGAQSGEDRRFRHAVLQFVRPRREGRAIQRGSCFEERRRLRRRHSCDEQASPQTRLPAILRRRNSPLRQRLPRRGRLLVLLGTISRPPLRRTGRSGEKGKHGRP